jgi:hypothetical protein
MRNNDERKEAIRTEGSNQNVEMRPSEWRNRLADIFIYNDRFIKLIFPNLRKRWS